MNNKSQGSPKKSFTPPVVARASECGEEEKADFASGGVFQWLEQLGTEVSGLELNTKSLAARLAPVLTSNEETFPKDEPVPIANCDVSQIIRELAERLRKVNILLEATTARISL